MTQDSAVTLWHASREWEVCVCGGVGVKRETGMRKKKEKRRGNGRGWRVGGVCGV